MIRRLRTRFVCIVMTIVTVMLCVIFGLIIRFTAQSMTEQTIGAMQAVMPETGGPPGAEGRPKILMPYFSVTVDRDGNVLSTGGYEEMVEAGAVPRLLEEVLASEREGGILWEYGLRFQRQEGPADRRVIFVDISANLATLGNLIRNCMAIGIAAWLAFWMVSVWLARWAVRPVEEAWKQQKQFIADASHELKTPLTVITTNAELLQSQGQGQLTDSILTMARQMRNLVESMLELARVDNGTARMEFRELNLTALTGEALLPFEPLFFEKDLLLTSEIGKGIRAKGSEVHLKQLMDILLDNAMKYSRPGGTVTVKLTKQGFHSLLSVAGPGEAISREDLSNIFKRFYRVDKARRRDGGYGLGLSIAQRIVEQHKGRIWAESSGGINTFFVQLPLQ